MWFGRQRRSWEQHLGIGLWTLSQPLKNQELHSCWQISYSWSRPILLPVQVNTKAIITLPLWHLCDLMSVLVHHTQILLRVNVCVRNETWETIVALVKCWYNFLTSTCEKLLIVKQKKMLKLCKSQNNWLRTVVFPAYAIKRQKNRNGDSWVITHIYMYVYMGELWLIIFLYCNLSFCPLSQKCFTPASSVIHSLNENKSFMK